MRDMGMRPQRVIDLNMKASNLANIKLCHIITHMNGVSVTTILISNMVQLSPTMAVQTWPCISTTVTNHAGNMSHFKLTRHTPHLSLIVEGDGVTSEGILEFTRNTSKPWKYFRIYMKQFKTNPSQATRIRPDKKHPTPLPHREELWDVLLRVF